MAVTDDAIDKIKRMIMDGELVPGDRLPPEKELSERLGLSRNSLREAVKALEVIRVLDVRRGDGTYVTSLNPQLLLEAISFFVDIHDDKSLLEIFAVRRILESHASGLAAALATVEQIQGLRAELHQIGAGMPMEELVDHDVRFHQAIIDISGNTYLTSLLASLTTETVRARVWRGLTEGGAVAITLHEHEAILDAIEAHDVELAQAASAMHIAGVERWLRRAQKEDIRRGH